VYLIASEAVGAGLGLAFWAVAARLFPNDADLGVGAILITGATLLATLSTLGFNFSLIRFLPEGRMPVARLINSSVTLGAVLALDRGGLPHRPGRARVPVATRPRHGRRRLDGPVQFRESRDERPRVDPRPCVPADRRACVGPAGRRVLLHRVGPRELPVHHPG